jgi:hypothetical protein
MTKTLADARLVPCNPLPRYVRRIIHDTERCHYQREEYRTAPERNLRFAKLRSLHGIVRYSDTNAIGLLVYVVAWPRQSNDNGLNRNGEGMTGANRETTGGRVPFNPAIKSQELPSDSSSMELSSSATGKLEKSEIESDSI